MKSFRLLNSMSKKKMLIGVQILSVELQSLLKIPTMANVNSVGSNFVCFVKLNFMEGNDARQQL